MRLPSSQFHWELVPDSTTVPCKHDSQDIRRTVRSLASLTAWVYCMYTHGLFAHPCSGAVSGPAPHPYLLRESARFVTYILRVFGISTAGLDELGFGGPGLTVSQEQLLQVLRDFRSSIASSPQMTQACHLSITGFWFWSLSTANRNDHKLDNILRSAAHASPFTGFQPRS